MLVGLPILVELRNPCPKNGTSLLFLGIRKQAETSRAHDCHENSYDGDDDKKLDERKASSTTVFELFHFKVKS